MNYLTDTRDRAIATVTPTVIAPQFGQLAPVALGQYRFVMASDGPYLQARSAVLAVTLKLASVPNLPYGTLMERVDLVGGPIPALLLEQAAERSVQACPHEWAGLIVWDDAQQQYVLHEPEAKAQAHRVDYDACTVPEERVVLDLHSHGAGRAYFSSTDDRCDVPYFYLAGVLGRCASVPTMEIVCRICVYGRFFEVPWTPFSEGFALRSACGAAAVA